MNTESSIFQSEEKRQRAVAAKDSRDHEHAHKLLLGFFPKIPEGDCTQILEHGFQKGSGRVGRSQILEDRIKVELAVNAHIRHRLTQYDSILAASKWQDAKLVAREMVHGQVQAIADSWRATSSQAWNTKARTSVFKDSAETLEANRQRRTKGSKRQATPADEAQVLDEALGGLHLDEKQREARARVKTAQGFPQKVARKVAHKGRSRKLTRELLELLRQYELDPSIETTKNKRKRDLRLQIEEDERLRKGRYRQTVHDRQDANQIRPAKQDNRKLRITANGVELEPRGQTLEMRLGPHAQTAGRVVEHDRYVPDYGPSDDQPPKPLLLRSNYRKPGNIPTDSGDLVDKQGNGLQLEARGARGYDRYVSTYDSPRNSRYPLRSSHRRIDNFHTNTGDGLGSVKEPTREGRLLVEDSEWMDIDDISLRTAGVHLG